MLNKTLDQFCQNTRSVLKEIIKKELELFGINKAGINKDNSPEQNLLIKEIKQFENNKNFKMALEHFIENVTSFWFSHFLSFLLLYENGLLTEEVKSLNELDLGEFKKLFIKSLDYTEPGFDNKLYSLLFPFKQDYLESVKDLILNPIPLEEFNLNQEGSVETAGWLYQSFNSNYKDKIFSEFKNNKKVNKSTLPIATQIFTPDWITKYLVENSLGKVWINHLRAHNPGLSEEDIAHQFKWYYFVPTGKQTKEVEFVLAQEDSKFENINIEEIKFFDPSMGTGHILSYAFDLFLQIYLSEDYDKEEAVLKILEKNLFGLDIDPKVTQLARVSLLVKASKYNKKVSNSILNLYSVPDSNNLNLDTINFLISKLDPKYAFFFVRNISELFNNFKDASLIGSILRIDTNDLELMDKILGEVETNNFSEKENKIYNQVLKLIKVALILSLKYEVVSTNPPYMGSRNFDPAITKALEEYSFNHRDLFSAFIEQNHFFLNDNGICSMIVQPSFITVKSYKNLREFIIDHDTILSLLYMGRGIFGIDFGSAAFVFKKGKIKGYQGTYFKLFERTFQYLNCDDIEKLYLDSLENPNFRFNFNSYDIKTGGFSKNNSNEGNKLKFKIDQDEFKILPRTPFAFWISEGLINAYINGQLMGEVADVKQGMATTNNNRFVRYWYEVEPDKIYYNAQNLEDAQNSGYKWFPYNKGGEYRKWYGNNEHVMNWENNGEEVKAAVLKKYPNATSPNFAIKNIPYYFKPSFSWSLITAIETSFRYKQPGFLFDIAGMSLFSQEFLFYLGALCNSKIAKIVLDVYAPTINHQVGDIALIPVLIDKEKLPEIENLVKSNINLMKEDWDSFELSWDFKAHPLIKGDKIEESFLEFKEKTRKRFELLKKNEEKLNKIFLKIYSLEDINPQVSEESISVRLADKEREVKSFLSYFIGCSFGRYSLKNEGVISPSQVNKNSEDYHPVKDGVIVLTETEDPNYVINLLNNWLVQVYEPEYLEENLEFIAQNCGLKNTLNPINTLKNYFLNNFSKDHNSLFNKRPIYWEFNSGRYKAFKALVYYFNLNNNVLDHVIIHLDQAIQYYEKTITQVEGEIKEIRKRGEIKGIKMLNRQLNKLQKQLEECNEYKQRLVNLNKTTRAFNFDDGILKNKKTFQQDENGITIKVLN